MLVRPRLAVSTFGRAAMGIINSRVLLLVLAALPPLLGACVMAVCLLYTSRCV